MTSPPSYPELLPEALGRRARGIEVVNLAEPGTTAGDWRPEGSLFDERLAPELGATDVVVVTLGGNDMERALGATDGLDGLERAGVARARKGLERFESRLGDLFVTIRARDPDTAIVYVGYPDYSEASVWRETAGATGAIALELGLEALTAAAGRAEPDLLVAMDDATARAGVDSLLADAEHLSPAGHELYARVLARELTARDPD